MKAVFSFRCGRQTVYVLPLRGLAYAAASGLLVALLLLLVDRAVLPAMERGGLAAGEMWQRHNRLIDRNHALKNRADEQDVRHWTGMPAPSPEESRTRILVMGDSFVWGAPYLSLNHMWWRQLELELARRGYRGLEVLAAGQAGWSTRMQVDCAKKLLERYQPDLVIWGYVTNDPDEKLVPQIFDTQDRPPYPHRLRVALKRVYPNLAFKFESLRAQKLAAQYTGPKYGYEYHEWELQLLRGENFARYRKTVAEVGSLMESAGVPTFMMTLPSFPSRSHFEPRYRPVLSLWREAGIETHDVLDEFVARYGEVPFGPQALEWGINPADSHPGPRAAHFLAVQAADYIESRWPNVLPPKSAAPAHVPIRINDWLPADLEVEPRGDYGFVLRYPPSTALMPVLPLGEPTALVALATPQAVGEIRLRGAGLMEARIWISLLDPREDYDDGVWHDLGSQSGVDATFHIPDDLAGRELSIVRIAAEVGGNRELLLEFTPAGKDAL